MEVYYINNLNDLPELEKNSCAIGNFDGLHQGHRDLVNKAKIDDLKTLVITFESINKANCLTNPKQKIELIEEMGVDYLIIFPFKTIQLVFFNEFIDILKKLKVKHITCGKDFRFGYKREGDIIDLKKKFKTNVLDDFEINRTRVSSTIIKEFIRDGFIEEANNLLTKPYTIVGEVVHGNKLGRKLGFPTANIDYNNYVLPKKGVYFTITKIKDKKYLSMTNIGLNPTLNEQENTRLEIHIIDFNEEIYGEEIEVSFIKFLRDEKRYESKEELVASLEETINICRNYEYMVK